MATKQHAVYWRDAEGDYRAIVVKVPESVDPAAAAHVELNRRGVAHFAVVAAEPLGVAKLEKRTFMHAVPGSRATDFFQQRALHLEARRCVEQAVEAPVVLAVDPATMSGDQFLVALPHNTPFLKRGTQEPEEPKVPAGYTAEELDRDNPYNAWFTPEPVEPPNNTPRGLMVMSAIGYRLGNTWSPE